MKLQQLSRQWNDILAVEKGKPITIDFSNTERMGVKGFYVTLDEKFAQESSPSELNAWQVCCLELNYPKTCIC